MGKNTDFFIYILSCADGTLYIGSTNDLIRRLKQHNESKSGAHYTKIRRPVKLAYKEEAKTYAEARKKEAELKRLTRKQKLDLIRTKSISVSRRSSHSRRA